MHRGRLVVGQREEMGGVCPHLVAVDGALPLGSDEEGARVRVVVGHEDGGAVVQGHRGHRGTQVTGPEHAHLSFRGLAGARGDQEVAIQGPQHPAPPHPLGARPLSARAVAFARVEHAYSAIAAKSGEVDAARGPANRKHLPQKNNINQWPSFESMSFIANILVCKLKIVNNRN